MKRTKRILALLLAAMLCFYCSSAVFAADGNGAPEPSAAILGLERTGGAIANVLGQALLAKKMGKPESAVSRWISGFPNLTLRSISELSAALDEPLIVIAGSLDKDIIAE